MLRGRAALLLAMAAASGCTFIAPLGGLSGSATDAGTADATGIDASADSPAPPSDRAVPDEDTSIPPMTDAATDAGADADAGAMCATTAMFGGPSALLTLDDMQSAQGSLRFAPTELLAYFQSTRTAPDGHFHLWSAARATLGDVFGAAVEMSSVASSADDYDPFVTTDNRTLYFSSDRGADAGPDAATNTLYVATRGDAGASFGGTATLPIDSPVWDAQPFVTADGEELWFTSARTGTLGLADIYVSRRTNGAWAAPVDETELNSPYDEWLPTLSHDGMVIYFASKRTDGGAKGGFDVWRAVRTSRFGKFGAPTNVSELNGPQDEQPNWLSADGCRLYLQSNEIGSNSEFFLATRSP